MTTSSPPPQPPASTGQGGTPTPSPTTLERLEVLRGEWAAGTPPRELARFCRERWGIGERQARTLVARFRQQIRQEMDDTTRAELVSELVERYREQYRASHRVGNHAAAVGALSGMSRALGLPDLPAIEARAQRDVCLQVLEVIHAANIPQAVKIDLQLRLAIRGLAPLPALERAPLEVVERFAAEPLPSGATDETGQMGADGLDSEPED